MQNLKSIENNNKFSHLLQFGFLTPTETQQRYTKPVVLPVAQEPKFSKRDYNKAYYQQRKQKKANDPNPIASTQRKFFNFQTLRILEIIVFGILVTFMTVALVKEAASFYLASQESALYAYFKAGIIETIAIIFSFARSKHWILKWIQRITMVLFCGFTLYLMSGSAIKTASTDTMKTEVLRQTLQQLEVEFKQKEQMRNEYFKNKYLTTTRRYDKLLDETRKKLDMVRQELCTAQAPTVIAQNLRIVIVFRVLLVIANLVCIHRIVELIASKTEKRSEKRKKHV